MLVWMEQALQRWGWRDQVHFEGQRGFLVDCKWVGREREAYVWAEQLGRGLVCSEMGGLREGEQVGGRGGQWTLAALQACCTRPVSCPRAHEAEAPSLKTHLQAIYPTEQESCC